MAVCAICDRGVPWAESFTIPGYAQPLCVPCRALIPLAPGEALADAEVFPKIERIKALFQQYRQDAVASGFLGDLLAELSRARLWYPPIHSLHEGYAVMLEELDEFWDICRQKPDARNLAGARKELLQVAAMAWRTAIDCL